MTFPVVQNALMCEQGRAESDGKLTLLGFLGVCPHVKFALKVPSANFSLTFVFLCETGEGEYEVSFELRGKKYGRVGKRSPSVKVSVEANKPAQFLIQFITALPGPDKYCAAMFAEGTEKGKAEFEVLASLP